MAIKVRKIENGEVTQEGTKITDEVLASIVYKDEDGIKFENGRIGFQNTGWKSHEWKGIYGVTAVNDNWVIRGSQLDENVGYLEIATGDDGTEPIYVSQYGVSGALNCQDTNMGNTNRRTAALLDTDGHTRFPGEIYSNNRKVYHSENKPTVGEIGALPNNSTWNGGSVPGTTRYGINYHEGQDTGDFVLKTVQEGNSTVMNASIDGDYYGRLGKKVAYAEEVMKKDDITFTYVNGTLEITTK